MSCDFTAFANTGVQGLHPYQPGKPIEELQRELGLEHIIKLASNENPLGPSPKALAACSAAFPDLCLYPDGSGFELKSELSAKFGVGTDTITLGNGSNDILDLVGRAYLRPGTNAVFSQHAFAIYGIATQANGAESIVVPAKHWGHDLEAMAAAVNDQTQIVFIANPNNPTGTHVSKAELVKFLDSVPDRVIVLLDEAYIEYVEEDNFPDGMELFPRYPNLMVTRTFSKAYGLAGLRVGYSISNPQIADMLNRVRAAFNVNSLALTAAVAVLKDDDYLRESRRINREGMVQLEQGFAELGLDFIPSTGNFIAAEFELPPLEVYEKLLRKGIIVRPVGVYEMPRHLRITIGLPEENEALLRALKAVL